MQQDITKQIAADILQKLDFTGLSRRQRLFVLYYAAEGDAPRAARLAGYKGRYLYHHKNTAWRLLQIPAVQKNLEILDTALESELIANAAECKMRLTDVVRDPKTPIKYQLNALKLLLQTHGELSEKVILEKRESKRVDVNVVFKHLPPGPLGKALGYDGDTINVDAKQVEPFRIEDII